MTSCNFIFIYSHQDILYKPPKKGILLNKLIYRRYNKPRKDEAKANEKQNDSTQVPEVDNVAKHFGQMTLEEEYSCLLFFKTCLIDRDKDILKIKMQQTIQLREKTIRKRETKFIESFPFYFVSPDLVKCFDRNFYDFR